MGFYTLTIIKFSLGMLVMILQIKDRKSVV